MDNPVYQLALSTAVIELLSSLIGKRWECPKPKQHVLSIMYHGCSIHQKHSRDVSGQLYWREQFKTRI